jgi:hypothetical protein
MMLPATVLREFISVITALTLIRKGTSRLAAQTTL